MHKYLRAVGFSKIKSRKDIQKLIVESVKCADKKACTTIDDDVLYMEYRASYGDHIGLCIRGEYDESGKFIYDYMIPCLDGKGITTCEDITVERHIEKLSYAGIVDDYKIGVSIIFYLQNIIPYLKCNNNGNLPLQGTSLTLSALSTKGTILFPIEKNEIERNNAIKYNMRKSRMIAEARNGNEQAIENLTLQDIDVNTVVHKKALEEDVYSLVDTYFMPYGVECDLYAILGEITDVQKVQNVYTKENVYIMTLDVNDIIFDIAINEEDLVGEPQAGRRFKGIIWLQGFINFPD